MRVAFDSASLIDSFGEDEAGEVYMVDINGGVYHVTSQP
jgi:hypothetical protein